MDHTYGMTMTQMEVFSDADDLSTAREDFPDGFRYAPELITPEEEVDFLARMKELPFRDFEFHGYKGKRRVVSFGWQYDFASRETRKAEDIPHFLLELRLSAAHFAGVEPGDLQHVLVTEYGEGAGIGWHRDKAVFGIVVGISLLSPCIFRLRRRTGPRRWDRVSLIAEPRSAYILGGAVRDEWEHSIPSVNSLRYSVTFRTISGHGSAQDAQAQ
jgi:alkylated DNA repair dioxygenase AlkB